MTYTSQVGLGEVGFIQVGSGDAGVSPPPPFDPSGQPWEIALGRPLPFPAARRITQASHCFAPELAQPLVNPSTIPWEMCSTISQEITPYWRRRTQPSVILWAPPPGIAQQINFFGYGIPPGAIGIPTITGGAQRVAIYMGGADITQYVLAFSVFGSNFSQQINTTGTAQYQMRVPVVDSFRPQAGMSILWQEFGMTKFAGYVVNSKKTIYPGSINKALNFDISAVDKAAAFQRRRVSMTTIAGDTLYHICAQLCGLVFSWGITPDAVDRSLTVDDSLKFDYIPIEEALNNLAADTDTVWWVDVFGVLWMQRTANLPMSAYVLNDSGGANQVQSSDPGMQDALTQEDSLDNYRNKQYVRTSSDLLSLSVTLTATHVFDGTIVDQVVPTDYQLTGWPISVKENGVELIGTDRVFELKTDGTPTRYPIGGDGYYWATGFYGLFHWPTNTIVPLGTLIVMLYTGSSTAQSNIAVYADPAEIARMAAITGTDGIMEELLDYSGAISYDAALALAKGIEKQTAPPPQKFTLSTINILEGVGYRVAVNLPDYDTVGTYIIREIQATALSNLDLGKGTTFQTTAQLVESRTQGNWLNWFQRLLARIFSNQISTPAERPTWALAYDSPGNISPGLQTGSFGSPYPIETGLGRIVYVSAVFATAPAAAIEIDILLNGVSIFDSAKLQYAPGNWPNQVLYGNFAKTPTSVQRGDLLLLQVVSVDPLTPGKNGTVTVVIEPS